MRRISLETRRSSSDKSWSNSSSSNKHSKFKSKNEDASLAGSGISLAVSTGCVSGPLRSMKLDGGSDDVMGTHISMSAVEEDGNQSSDVYSISAPEVGAPKDSDVSSV